jgi:hypothetical protein
MVTFSRLDAELLRTRFDISGVGYRSRLRSHAAVLPGIAGIGPALAELGILQKHPLEVRYYRDFRVELPLPQDRFLVGERAPSLASVILPNDKECRSSNAPASYSYTPANP